MFREKYYNYLFKFYPKNTFSMLGRQIMNSFIFSKIEINNNYTI